MTDQDLFDVYVYLRDQALVIRQEQTDITEEGVDYNVLQYNPLGSADFVNPNLDVAYLEAWIAVDDHSPVLLEIPPIADHYYAAQLCDEWGEVITNLNQRCHPTILPGSPLSSPQGRRQKSHPAPNG